MATPARVKTTLDVSALYVPYLGLTVLYVPYLDLTVLYVPYFLDSGQEMSDKNL